jgi:tetratricopeptide (TPR) repeat protein
MNSLRQSRFSRHLRVLLLTCAGAALGLMQTSCNRPLPPEEKAVRAELRHALREHSYEQAVELATRVVRTAPRENGAWERLVRAQIGTGDLAAAKQTLSDWRKAVRRTSPKFDELTGDIASREGDPASAFPSWQRALASQPANARLVRKMARLHGAHGNWAEQNAAMTTLIEIEDNATDRINRALCRRRLQRWSEAVDDYRRAVELAPDDPEVRRGAKLFERLGKFLVEIRKFNARLAITPGDDQLLTDRALLFLRSDDPEMALEDSSAAKKLAPWAIRPTLFEAIALLKLERVEECEKLHVHKQLRLDSLTPEFLQTISRLDAEISVERSNPELFVSRAWQLNDIGQPKLAIADAETAMRLDPNSAGARAESGYALAKLGRVDEAFEHIRQATELDPNFSTALHYRGELEMSRGDHVAAIESLSRSLAINQTAAALQKREECYRHVGLIEKAEEDRLALQDFR